MGPVEAIAGRCGVSVVVVGVCGQASRGAARGVRLSSRVSLGRCQAGAGNAERRVNAAARSRPRAMRRAGAASRCGHGTRDGRRRAVAGSAGAWVRRWQLAGQEQSLGPDDQVVGEAHDLKPHLVVFEGTERQVAHPGVFVVADVVLDASAAAVVALELSDRAGLVGEDRLEAMTVVVGEGQLRAGVRALAPDDHPRALRPAG